MSDETEILLKMYEEQWTQARHSQEQKATVTNLVITLASAGIAFIAQTGLNPTKLPITVLLIILGLYGAFTSEKISERSRYHIIRARFLRKRLDKWHPNAKAELTEILPLIPDPAWLIAICLIPLKSNDCYEEKVGRMYSTIVKPWKESHRLSLQGGSELE